MDKDKIEDIINKYKVFAKENGFSLNPEKEVAKTVIKGLFANEKKWGFKYCPCRMVVGDDKKDSKKICPCFWHKDEIEKQGHCHCNLFVKKLEEK